MTGKGSNKRITRNIFYLAALCCVLLVSACQQNNSETNSVISTGGNQELDLSNQPIVEENSSVNKGENILGDGFYSGTDKQPVDALKPGETVQNSIVADSDFSKKDSDTNDTEAQIETYCINSEIKSTPNSISTDEACEMISNRLASVSYQSCASANLQYSQCSSVSGFPILVSEFAPLNDREPQGRILVIGGTHGDELTSVSISFRWIEKLNKYHSGLFHWHVAPMMNPDGVLNRSASRTNKNGVDLNRNMPSDDWEENALKYWEEKQGKNARKYPGEHPASEPETQWLIDEINTFKPDAIISVHAPYGVVDFDALALNTAPRSLGKLTLNLLGTYPGSLGNYAGINRDIPVITLELPHAWDMPSDKETTKIWEDIVSWLRKNVRTEQLAKIDD